MIDNALSFARRCLAAILLTAMLTGPILAQDAAEPHSVTVSEPTRIDWTFVLATRSVETVPDDWLSDYPDEVTYEFYIPDSIDAEQANGLILFISPTPRAMAVQSRWRAVCDELGLMLAAPHGAGNDCDPPLRTKIILDVLDDVRRKHSIDTDRTYVAGFSGGGRMACNIAFALPEYFGGVIPIGAAGELRGQETWLQQRVANRISVAFVLGAEDFNHCEVTAYRGPLLESSGVRTTIRVVDGLDHKIPESSVLIEAVQWLEETIERRQQLADQFPASRISGDRDPPSAAAQAANFYNEAQMMLSEPDHSFDGYMLLKGLVMRWPDSPHSELAKRHLGRDRSWQRIEMKRLLDYMVRRARGFERLALEETHEMYLPQRKARIQTAIGNWENIAKSGGDRAAVAEARERIRALKQALDETPKDPTGPGDKQAGFPR